MARPQKNGLDYFSHDVDLSSDFKIEFLEAKHGITGYGFYIKLLERIYRDGYFLKWDETTALITASKVNVDINSMSDMINDCLEVGLFSQEMFKQYSILTSAGIQKRYLRGCLRRKQVFLIKEYMLTEVIDDKNNSQEVVIVNINPHSHVVNVDKSTQSKVNRKESKKKLKNTRGFSEEFEIWWKTYPARNGRKVGKQKAAPVFDKIKKADLPGLKRATQNYSQECNGYPKDAERFLRNEFWKDYLTSAKPKLAPIDDVESDEYVHPSMRPETEEDKAENLRLGITTVSWE